MFDNDQFNLKKFLDDQCKEIKKYRDEQIKKTGKDLGTKYANEWIEKNAKRFREDAIKSGKYKKR